MSVQEQIAQIAMTLSESDAQFILDCLSRIAPKNTEQVLGRGIRLSLNFDSYGEATERGRDVEAYMREARDNDRV